MLGSTKKHTDSTSRQVGFRATKNSGPVKVRAKSNATQQSVANADSNSVARPSVKAAGRAAPPLPKRNKGRLFVGTIFLSIFTLSGYLIWTSFFQYQSYGIIDGQVIAVSAPWNGVVANWQVKEGDTVQQGQALAEISNLELRYELESLIDELKLTQASLNAETTKLRFQAHQKRTQSEQALAEYLEASGDLEAKKVEAEEIHIQFSRAKRLKKSGNLSQSKFDELRFKLVGHTRHIKQMQLAVDALKKHYELSKQGQQSELGSQIEPLLAKMESIQSQIERLRDKIGKGLLIAPVSGRVTKRMALTGESVQRGESVFEVMEDDSTKAVLYVPQENVGEFKVGARIAVELPPYDEKLECEIIRLGDQLEHAPRSIERYYAPNIVLCPVHLKPLSEYEQFMSLRINGVIKLPFEPAKIWKKDFDKSVTYVRELVQQNSTPKVQADQASLVDEIGVSNVE